MTRNIFQAFLSVAQAQPDCLCVWEILPKGERKHSFGKILEESKALAAFFQSQACQKGDRIGILAENRAEWLVAYLGIVAWGGIALPLDPQLPAYSLAHLIGHASPRFLIVSERTEKTASEMEKGAASFPISICLGENPSSFPSFLAWNNVLQNHSKNDFQPPPVDPNEIASLIYTSGTTADPKGVLLTHRNLLSNAGVINLGYRIRGETMATILPFHHVYGFTVSLSTLVHGATGVYFPEFQPEVLRRGMLQAHPHYLIAVPALFEALGNGILRRLESETPSWFARWVQQAPRGWLGKKADRLSWIKRSLFKKVHQGLGGRIKFLASGGAPLEPYWIRFFNLLGLKFFEGYGLTETSPLISCNDDQAQRIGSVGRPVKDTELRIASPNQKGIGEICVRGPGVMRGYFQDSEATARVLDAEGSFHTGDLGYLDPEGFLFITGRLKDVIVTANGKSVYPDEIERLLRHLPWIGEVCVFGIPQHPGSRAERVHAQIVPNREALEKAGHSDWREAIQEAVNQASREFPDYARPRSLGFSELPFPRTTTLKIQKFRVREDFLRKQTADSFAGEERPTFLTPEEKLLEKILRDTMGRDLDFHLDSNLILDLGLDSLKAMELRARMEKESGRRISDETFFELQTVRDLLNFLVAGSGSPLPEAGATGPLEPQARAALRRVHWPRQLALKIMAGILRIFCRLRVRDLKNLPAYPPYLLTPNHETFLDYFFVVSKLPRRVERNVIAIAEPDFFLGRGFLKWLVRHFAQILFIDPGRVSAHSMRAAGQLLQAGKILLIFPEGVRSPDGQLQPLRPGFSLLAQQAECPIVPVFLEGGFEFWPKGRALPRLGGRVTVTFGEVLEPTIGQRHGAAEHREQIAQLIEALRARLEEMRHGKP